LPCPPLLLLWLCGAATSGEGGRSSADNPDTPLLQLHAALCTVDSPGAAGGGQQRIHSTEPGLSTIPIWVFPAQGIWERSHTPSPFFSVDTSSSTRDTDRYCIYFRGIGEASQQASTRPLTAQPSTSLNSIARRTLRSQHRPQPGGGVPLSVVPAWFQRPLLPLVKRLGQTRSQRVGHDHDQTGAC
jgi:hypothetical protein